MATSQNRPYKNRPPGVELGAVFHGKCVRCNKPFPPLSTIIALWPLSPWNRADVESGSLLCRVRVVPCGNGTTLPRAGEEGVRSTYSCKRSSFMLASVYLRASYPVVTLFSFARTLNRFVDLATMAKVSVLILDEKFHGWYLHCRSPYPRVRKTPPALCCRF